MSSIFSSRGLVSGVAAAAVVATVQIGAMSYTVYKKPEYQAFDDHSFIPAFKTTGAAAWHLTVIPALYIGASVALMVTNPICLTSSIAGGLYAGGLAAAMHEVQRGVDCTFIYIPKLTPTPTPTPELA